MKVVKRIVYVICLSVVTINCCSNCFASRSIPDKDFVEAFNSLHNKPFNEAQFEAYLKKGISIDSANASGTTLLMKAVGTDNDDAVKFLVEKNAKINVFNGGGSSALGIAAVRKNPDIFIYLIENGADIEKIDTRENKALHFAAREGLLPAVEYLVRVKKVNIDAQGEDAKTALHYAMEHFVDGLKRNWTEKIKNQSKVLGYLLENKAACTIKDTNGKTAVDYANEALKSIKDEKNSAKLEEVIAKCKDK